MFIIWKGKFSEVILEAEQRSYAMAKAFQYPDDIETIDCALGTNPLGMPECLKKASLLSGGYDLCGYPVSAEDDLKEAISSAHVAWNISPDQILVGGGSMGVLVTLARILISRGAVLSGISPQFTDAVVQCLCNGASYRPVILEAPRYNIRMDQLLEALVERPDVLYIDRPNNPTGQVLSLENLEKLAVAGIESGTWIISDEAYGDYLPDEESAATLDFPNLITCRSFSKALGAAGLRVGFAVSRDVRLSELFVKAQPPFVIGTIDASMAVKVIGEREFLEKTRRYVQDAKTRVVEILHEKGDLSVADTDLRVPILLLSQKGGDLAARLADKGISCEAGSGFFDMDDSSVRLRVPSPDRLGAFLDRIKML